MRELDLNKIDGCSVPVFVLGRDSNRDKMIPLVPVGVTNRDKRSAHLFVPVGATNRDKRPPFCPG